jgi:hypothetical protein
LPDDLSLAEALPRRAANARDVETLWNEAWPLALGFGHVLESPMKTLADAFEHTLQDVYYAENAITKALPKVIDAVTNAHHRPRRI